ncbi:carbohydrate ABC transporter permease [Vagococcus fluvialis]|uniref:ABC transporter permease n=1 Tax=Vagococcus fluvialis TaxID=2738 RepID=A0A369ASW5_9ENTE|nr:carbohydrate ABC transporter permease [Vagococcus fluvialis]MCM2139542.1 carbohydrate ABC transporter permease [Vagococcus fluvialis]MDT2782544.1 carbohydrate ABC transporter permease [Vagococcus fluvialis]NKC58392.1 carbohydrate ABC transporter permease [Vagococcus fluvialis]NKD49376.1 carbohydrate ABC transporter permease [Vagococcus fluvialis]RCX12439.1 carbohydrate ABC transporter membrane protein 2 (CUT1 family) [Vagococcus fluvialis]
MKRKRRMLTIVEYTLLILLAMIFLFPMIWMIVSSMKPEADVFNNLTSFKAFLPSLNPANWFKTYQAVVSRFSVGTYLFNSLFYGLTFAFGSILVNSLAGFAFAKINFSGKKVIFGLLLALLIIPMETVLIPQFTIITKLGLVNNRLAVILPGIASAFNIYLFRNFFIAIPEEIIESAKLDGASTLQIFFKIMLPMSKPAIATVGVLSFIGSWNDYIWPLMVLTDKSKFSMQVAITAINTTQPVYINQVMAVLTISTIPLIIVYIVAQKYIVQGLGGSGTGIK